MVVCGERAQDSLIGVVAVPDHGGEREESLEDANEDCLRAVTVGQAGQV